jgi:SnoaL-like domain
MTDIDQSVLLRELKARMDINDTLVRFCRGVDRGDVAMTMSAYHPDGWDDHGSFSGSVADFVEWVMPMLANFVWSQHYITNSYVELHGDKAKVETSVQVLMRYEQDGKLFDLLAGGRYLDQFECRDGAWKIMRRLVTGDWDRIDEISGQMEGDLVQMLPHGTRDRQDPSYTLFSH